ncbi:MAG: protein kinase domain-containing protein [Planctomycetota bacterium]|jgi:hypothetical protein
MQDFRYKYGDKPLEGYTVQRAAGRGGFGEVYYALSDSGREVALKAVQNYEQIEVRGISQCMNLKNPHLVTIFDVKYNKQNRPFVIMEYVSGPSLRDLLAESPGGLGPQKAAFFLRETAKGLSFLHECGIVHRDLKPGNIFYENGYVKIGDYGLTKAISASQHSGQTITVGTVHYMAPEIGAGCYDRSIDIYALGILLYEMLSGQVPFFGSSPAEILMKHMTAQPELDNIEEPFARVIRKALAKDPGERYQTVQEMVEDVFGSEHVRNSVSQFSAEDLSMVAERVAEKVKTDQAAQAGAAAKAAEPGARDIGRRIGHLGEQIDAVGERVVNKFAAATSKGQPKEAGAGGVVGDPIDQRQRLTLALAAMAVVSACAGLYYGRYGVAFWPPAIFSFVVIGACSGSILLLRWRLLRSLGSDSRWLRGLATGIVSGLCAAAFGTLVIVILAEMGYHALSHYTGLGRVYPWSVPGPAIRLPFASRLGMWLPLAIVFSLVDWWRMTAPGRDKRASLSLALVMGLAGFAVGLIFSMSPFLLGCILAGTSLVVQIASPLGEGGAEDKGARQRNKKLRAKVPPGTATAVRSVPEWARILWLLGFVILFGVGLMLLIWTGMADLRDDDMALAVAFGIGGLVFSVFCLKRAFGRRFVSIYRYLVKPLLLLICLQSVVTSVICLGCMDLHDDEILVALFFIIFPGILFFVIAFLPSRIVETMCGRISIQPAAVYPGEMVSPYKRLWALLLSGGAFFGINGLHRFYVGKIGTGIVWLLTFGLFYIGQIVDLILICVGQFKDCNGARVTIWQDRDELRRRPMPKQPDIHVQAPEAAAVQDLPQANGEQQAAAQAQPAGSAPMPMVMPSAAYEPFNPFAFLLSFVGYLLLLLALVIGLGLALHLAWLVAAGFPEASLAEELREEFGYAGWPNLVERIAFAVGAGIFMLAAAFIIVARRHRGAVHIIRGAIGLLGLLLCLWALSEVFPIHLYSDPALTDMFDREEIGRALDLLFGRANRESAVWSAIFFIASVMILAWPPRRRQPLLTTASGNQEVK